MIRENWKTEDQQEIIVLRHQIDVLLKRMSLRAFDKDQRIRLTLIEIIELASKELRRLEDEFTRTYNSKTCV